MKRALVLPILVGLLLAQGLRGAGNLRPPAQQAVEMRKVAFMVGTWTGSGWVERSNRRYTFKETKRVHTKMKKRIFIIEGTQTVLLNDREDSQPFDMLAVLSYNEIKGVYQFRTHLANGYAGDHTAKLVNGAIEWAYDDHELGRTRYRIRLDEKGRWLETGESNKDGKTWVKFYENILVRSG